MTPRPQRVLVTGLDGFTGRYVGDALESAGYEVHGLVRATGSVIPSRYSVDLANAVALGEVIDAVEPDHVLHLAAVSFVAHGDVDDIYRTNLLGTRNLLATLARRSKARRPLRNVILASSANIYGNTNASPLHEDLPARPANDYAVSKAAMEQMATLWAEELPITIVRPFNYSGVGQSLQFLIPKIVDAHRRRLDVLDLGNLDVYRDFSDVRDVASAYVALLQASPRTTLNICSGRVHTLRNILEKVSDLSGHRLEIRVNPLFVRANEVKVLQGSTERLHRVLPHWQPRPFKDTLFWMLSAPEIRPQRSSRA